MQGRMPPWSACCTLAGFAAGIDWRPLHFVKPLPLSIVCSACGLVRTKTVLLACTHVLCGTCYEQCRQDGELVCPLDGLQSSEEGIKWTDLPAEELLNREVICWNQDKGCTAVMTASNIVQHFQSDCGHHSARCPKCSALVLCHNVCAHLRSGCPSLASPPLSEPGGQTGQQDEPPSKVPRRVPEPHPSEMEAPPQQLLGASSTLGHRLPEIARGVKRSSEAVKQEFPSAAQQSGGTSTESSREITAPNQETGEGLVVRDEVVNNLSSRMRELEAIKGHLGSATAQRQQYYSRLAAAIDALKDEVKENRKVYMRKSQNLRSNHIKVVQREFFVQGIKHLHDMALIEGFASYDGGLPYLRGYRMSPGILFAKYGQSVLLYLGLQLHSGVMDDTLNWPFQEGLRLSVVHPRGMTKLQLEYKMCCSSPLTRRPVGSNEPFFYAEGFVNLDDLLRTGYVDRDNLRLTLELI